MNVIPCTSKELFRKTDCHSAMESNSWLFVTNAFEPHNLRNELRRLSHLTDAFCGRKSTNFCHVPCFLHVLGSCGKLFVDTYDIMSPQRLVVGNMFLFPFIWEQRSELTDQFMFFTGVGGSLTNEYHIMSPW